VTADQLHHGWGHDHVFCVRHLLAARLRSSKIGARAGAEAEIARIKPRIRASGNGRLAL